MSTAQGDAASGSADPVATDISALRRHVCRVLGVDVQAEGEKLVPSHGAGSITRLDWTRVDAVLGGADEERPEGANDDADDAVSSRDATRVITPTKQSADDDVTRDSEPYSVVKVNDSDEALLELSASKGRVGPARVEIDKTRASGDVRVDAAGTSAQSRANFSSLRANACVFEGKWSYEATLGSSGIMQLGWCTARCPFTRENGVGDAPDSFAFDGHRVRKWNVSSQPYGKAWVAGDVITCTIDLTPGPGGGTVSYHRNGVPLGVAFDNVRRWRDAGGGDSSAAAALAYFPAVSLSMDERVALNFGDAPARYPVEGYAPLQASPDEKTVLAPAERGLRVFEALAAPPDAAAARVEIRRPLLLRFEEETLMAATALRRAGPLLASPATRRYITRGCLIPAIMRAAANSDALPEEAAAGAAAAGAAASSSPFPTPPSSYPPGRVAAYERAVALLCAALDPKELDAVVPELMAALAELARSAPLAVLDRRAERLSETYKSSEADSSFFARAPTELPRLASHAPLACAAALARHPAARHAWLKRRGWGNAVEGLLTRRIPNADDLAVMLPARAVCWPGAAALEPRFADESEKKGGPYPGSPTSETMCAAAGRALGEAMLRTQTLHAVLFRALVDPEKDDTFILAEPGTTEEDAPADPVARALVDARRASAATAAATAASALAGDPTAARRDQSFDADLDPDDEADFAASPAGSPAPRERRRRDSRDSEGSEEDEDDGWPVDKCRRSPLLVLLTWLAGKNKNAHAPQHGPQHGRDARNGHSDPTVLASAYFATLELLHPALEAPGETPLASPPPSAFHESLAHQLDLPLFGGGASHVSKTYPPAKSLNDRNGGRLFVDPADVRSMDAPPSDAALGSKRARRTLSHVGVCSNFELPLIEARRHVLPVTRLWDVTQLLYHLGVGYHFKAAAYQLQTQIQAAQHLEDASRRLATAERCSREAAEWRERENTPSGDERSEKSGSSRGPNGDSGDSVESLSDNKASDAKPAPPGDDLLAKLREARRALRDETVEAARLCWWHRAVLHRPDQQAAMFAAASYGAALLLSAMARRGAGEEPGTSRAASVSDIADSVDAEAEAEAEAFPSREEEASSVEASSLSSDRAEHENFWNASVDDVSVGDDPEKNRGALLPHVPAYHLESLIDSFHALRRGDPPFAPGAFAAPMPGLHSVVRLLVRHFHDDRVVNPDIRDAMLQSISVLLQYREYVDVFEKNDEARDAMVPALLKAFDSRFWIPVSNILLRLCRGAGFGQGAHKQTETRETGPPLESRDTNSESAVGADADTTAETAAAPPADPSGPDAALARALASPQPEGASPLFQRLLVDTCRSDPGLLAEFLDRLFNTLNWTVTEFGVTLKEALEGASRARQHETRQRRRKCAVMFELSVTLTRVLEFLTKELPEVFLKAHSLDLKRLTETLVFVLGHTTAGPDAALFDRALLAQIAPSDKVSRAAILAPVAGIVLNLDAASQDAAERLGLQASQNTDGNSDTSDTSGELDDVTDTDKTAFLCVESIAAELARSNADVAQLEFLRDFPWTDHFSFPDDENETSGEPLNSEKSSLEESLKEKSFPVVLARLRDFVRRVRATRLDVDRARETEDARSIPDEFVDPIMQTVMTDPVTLPGSGQVVDRATIRRHLLGDRTDPFSRSPLDESMLVPADDLRRRIEKWRDEAPAAHSLADID